MTIKIIIINSYFKYNLVSKLNIRNILNIKYNLSKFSE